MSEDTKKKEHGLLIEKPAAEHETKLADGEGDEDGLMVGTLGIIEMLKHVLRSIGEASNGGELLGRVPESPFDSIDDEDLDAEDDGVEEFKNDGGCKGIVKIIKLNGPDTVEKIASAIDKLTAIREAARIDRLRRAFACILNARRGSGRDQVEAADLLSRLASATNGSERASLISAREAVLEGSDALMDAAAFRVRQAHSSYIPHGNVRTAYTTLNTQSGEPYQMCPKAYKQVSKWIPMEVSKCRDQCIDVRIASDGKIGCAYADFLRKTADNQEAAMSRLDSMRHPDNEANRLNLKEGERSLPVKDDEKTWEERLESSHKTPSDQSIENQLEDAKSGMGHRGDPKADALGPNERKASATNTPMQENIKEKRVDKEVKNVLEETLDDAGVNSRKGEPKKSVQDVLEKKAGKSKGLDPDSGKTLGEQVEDIHANGTTDETIEEMLKDAREPFSEDELESLIEELLADQHENKD